MLRGADLVVRTLEALGVSRIFTLSGNHIMPLFDAVLSTGIELIHVRHEAACVHMADAWGRLTGEIGVAMVTGGQGHANGAAALYTALAAESPVLLLSGHAGLREFGRGAFQELAQAEMARPVTKASWTAGSAATLGHDIARAIGLATSGRRGPVHVSLPVDLLDQVVADDAASLPKTADAVPSPALDPAVADAVRAEIGEASRPLILCGPASCGERGRAAMRALEDALRVPVIGLESPRGINDPGLGAFAEILAEADLIVLIGKPLDFTLKFGDPPAVAGSCRFVVLDPDMAVISRAAHALGDRLLRWGLADAQSALKDLAVGGARTPPPGSGWRETVRDALAHQPPAWREARARSVGRLHPVELCREVASFLAARPGATLVCDGGEIGQWPQALVRIDRRIINGIAGTIGVSVPFALAAKLARPDRPVVAIVGDGAFGFHMAEFDTAVRYGIPIIVVVGNDARWNAEYQIQLRQYGGERAKHCELLPTRYDEIVAALGGFGALATSPAELRDALVRAEASGRPACINTMIESLPAPTIRR